MNPLPFQEHRDFWMLAIGEIQIATRDTVKHDRSDIAGIPHVDGLIRSELFFSDLLAGFRTQRPGPRDGIPQENELGVLCVSHLAIDPLEFAVPVIV